MKRKLLFTFLLSSSCFLAFSQFTAGNLVVLRVGDGSTTVAANTAPVSLLEFTPNGTAGTVINLNSTGTDKLTINGTSNEGILKLSADKRYLTLGGYDALTGVAATTNTTIGNTQKVIARIGLDGVVDYSTKIAASDLGGNLRNVISNDGSDLWLGSANSGVRYTTFGSTSTPTIIANPTGHTNVRSLGIYNDGTANQLFSMIYNSATYTITTIGSGLPTTSSQTPTNVPGIPIAAGTLTGDFVFLDLDATVPGVDVVYYQDVTAATLALKKYSLVSGTWVANGSVALSTGAYGMTGIAKNNKAILFYTDGNNTSNNNLKRLDDANGYNATISGTPTTIATSGTNYVFRGVAFTPNTTTLPVNLTSFTGKILNNGIQLNWETASEQNNKQFDILRSVDGLQFETIKTISGNGNSNQINKYSYLDPNPANGTNYYKLNQVDNDGKVNPSNVIAVKTGLAVNEFNIFTYNDNVSLSINATVASSATVNVVDINGRKLISKQILVKPGFNTENLSIAELKSGVYIASIFFNGKSYSKKILKY